MFSKTITRVGACAALALVTVAGATAQQTGLVNVDIRNVANNIAQNLKVDVGQIPVTVQAPISVAANVCGIDATVLSSQTTSSPANCTARTASTALNDIVQSQLKR
ncbi:MAG TPA: hypothetical protein VF169_16605 [Albitalea sp.]|uniref:hypothetical protein n=1 Tax=Piscinibacter sp. TaxID=1903157 RepID=UPI002ED4A7CC